MSRSIVSLARRAFLETNAVLALGATGPVHLRFPRRAAFQKQVQPPPLTATLRDPRVKALALQAVDAARSAGAQYATVRITNDVSRILSARDVGEPKDTLPPMQQTIKLGLSVRALVNGYWGWAATPELTSDDAVRVARVATQAAAALASRGKPRTIELGTAPIVHDGEWSTPMQQDPFALDPYEVQAWMFGTMASLEDLADVRGTPGLQRSMALAGKEGPGGYALNLHRQERVFASTEGSFLTQTITTVEPAPINIPYVPRSGAPAVKINLFNTFSRIVQGGFEWWTDAPLTDLVRAEMDEADATPTLQPKPMDPGRYDCVFSAEWMAQILYQTLAPAAEVDRVLGYEANASGTSYLGSDPLAILGTPVASPLVTITADRSMATGIATAKWDDEGVPTRDFTLVDRGTLVNFPTTREQAGWLAAWAAKHGLPVQSLGCAQAPDALSEPLQHTPNLTLHPGRGTETEASLVATLEHGLHFRTNAGGLFAAVGLQRRNMFIFPVMAEEIRHGKPVGTPILMALTFNADEFWKNIQTLGGPASARTMMDNPGMDGNVRLPFRSVKGDPERYAAYTINAVPARVGGLALVHPVGP